ncbi:Cell shape-determining protein [Streptococcus oralis]|uniref:Cell shape-determining protein n=1 Tax=Streptococcus oralis TaxID=1303 RepID=A0A139RKS8_STROR|nr:hypothetical protein [Streptococcus oralis]KXU15334.1 Cell shape-determining protein [Streptococcus oralis]
MKRIVFELIFIATTWYIFLPPLNLTSWEFIFFLCAHLVILGLLFSVGKDSQPIKKVEVVHRGREAVELKFGDFHFQKLGAFFILSAGGIFLLAGLVSLATSSFFQAKNYANVVTLTEKEFSEFPKSDTNKVPILDRDTAEKIGDRYLGSLTDKVSQYVAADTYTQLTVDGKPYRVTPLEYADPIKWFNNQSKGIGEYIKVDMVTGNAELVDLKTPMKYSDSEYFNRDVKRHLRFKYPTKIFKTPSFEVDDEGNPFYVATVYQKQFGLGVPRPSSVIILDATNGETKEYSLDDVPEWVDRVYPAEETIEQINYNGKYKDGFWNALISKKNVTQTTEGYNYLSIGNDIYLYTGVTSANADESNLGFILENMRTGEITKYNLASATEESARASAEGAVQEKAYKATFPILINLNDKPLYIMGLKDNAGLVKEYALVDAVEYQNVIVSTTVEELLSKYASKNDLDLNTETVETIKGVVSDLRSAVIKGDTVYFFKLEDKIYKVKASVSDDLPYLKDGQSFEGQVGSDNYLKSFKLQ